MKQGAATRSERGESAYLRLYERLKGEIAGGVRKRGERIPSKRQMAAEAGVSVITVEHAYLLLEEEGYVEARPRSGFYVDFSVSPGESGGEDVKYASPAPLIAAPEDFPFSVFARIMRRVISERGQQLLVRSPGTGCPELRSAIADHLRLTRGMAVDPGRIVVGSGAEYLYGAVAQLLGPGVEIALEEPCWDTIRRVYEAHGLRCAGLLLGSDGIRSEPLSACSAAALHVTPFHSYPSGITASAAKRHEYAAWTWRGERVLIEDDYDAEFASPRRQVDTICSLAPERVIYVNTFSKTVAPSMRMGYMVLPRHMMERYEERLGYLSCPVPVFDQYVLAEFIRGGHLQRYIRRRRRAGPSASQEAQFDRRAPQ